MLIVKDILVSDDIIEQQFICNLEACKGACCWEGDWGAPLEEAELETLMEVYKHVEPYLSEESKKRIEEVGPYTYFEEPAEYGTSLLKNGACVYMTKDEKGVAKCGIEQAYLDKKIDFKKPISCHLYPIRISHDQAVGFEALNYDRWDICSAACQLGKQAQMPLYRFVKDAIVRKYGESFYEELDLIAKYIKEGEDSAS